MNFGISHDYSSPAGVFNCKSSSTILSGNTADGSGKVIAVQRFDVLDLKAVDKEIIDSKQSNRIVCLKAKCKGLDKVGSLLQDADV